MTFNVLFCTNDLCRIFQVNRSTIHRWIRNGQLSKPRMLGVRSPRWTQKEITDFTEGKLAKEAI